MKETNALYKNIRLYNTQFDIFELQAFGSHKTTRLRYDGDSLLFKIKYMYEHNKDLDQIPEMHERFIDILDEVRVSFCEVIKVFLSNFLGDNNENDYSIDMINEIIIKSINYKNQEVIFETIVLSDNEDCLNHLDEVIKDDEVFNMFPDKFFRHNVESYSDAISKIYPELFISDDVDCTNKDTSIFTHNFTFQTTEDCNLSCSPAGTKILMADFTQKNIEDIQIGDIVLGFEEFTEYKKHRSLIPTEVTKLFKHDESCYKLTSPWLKNELYFTPNHPVLTGRGKWVEVKDLAPSDTLLMTEFDVDDFYDTDVNNIDYIKGYFIGGWMGDGCAIQSIPQDKYLRHFMRFTVKDEEMTERMSDYAKILGFEFSLIDYKISEKYNITTFGLYSGKKSEYDKWISLCNESLYHDDHSPEFLMGFLAGIYDAEGSIGSTLRIHNSDTYIMSMIEKGLKFLNLKYNYDKPKKPANKIVQTIRILNGAKGMLRFMKSVKNAIPRKGPSALIGRSLFRIIDCISKEYIPNAKTVYNFETTQHTYISDSILVHNCSYCYQINKTPGRMNFETAKKFIDNLLTDQYSYINIHNSPAIIIEFIGGDPLLEINLTKKIYEYFLEQCYELNHPWFDMHRISICTNGMLYFDRDVQSFFKKYSHKVSFNISIDGNKELQDSCRIQPNGEGSYDIDILALNHFNKYHTTERNSKMTLAPENMSYLFDSVVNFINEKMEAINLNCVFEDVWTPETATLEYNQLKKLADYLVDNDLEHLYIAIFDETPEDRLDKSSDNNWCFKAGTQVLTYNGNKNIEDIKVGEIIYTASGTKHVVTKIQQHHSTRNLQIKATGVFPIECTSEHKFFAKKFLYRGWKDVKHYSNKDFYPLSELNPGDKIGLSLLPLHRNTKSIDPKLAYLLGVFLADGWCNKNNVIITPGYDKDGYYRNLLKDIGLIFTETDGPTTMQYKINANASSINTRYIELCNKCGHGAANKHMPFELFQWNSDTIANVLDGYLATDGYVDKSGFTNVNTVSPHLANDVLILLRSIGYFPTVYFNARAGKSIIQGREVTVRDRYEIYFRRDRNHNGQMSYDGEYPVLWSTIKSILPSDEFDVYNMTVNHIDDVIDGTIISLSDSNLLYKIDDASINNTNSYLIQGKPHTDIKSKSVYEDNPDEIFVKPIERLSEHTIIVNGVSVSQCGGLGSMLALDYKGKFYPCIRYMPSSLGTKCKEQCIGHIDTGMVGREEGSEILAKMDNITRRSQSNDICFDCPIGSSCAWCFKAGTLIETERGPVPIEDITKDDMVLSQNGNYNEVEGLTKRESFCIKNKPFAIGALGTSIIYTTEEHPFWVKIYDEINNMFLKPDWVEAKDIKIGDMIYLRESSRDHAWTDVTIAEIPNEKYDVYNLSVKDDPSYYADGVLVHNCSGLCHQTYGTADKRTQFICVQMFAEHLANCYYWNLLLVKKPEYNLSVRKIKIPDEWALKVIDQEELEMLRLLETAAMVKKLEHSSKI